MLFNFICVHLLLSGFVHSQHVVEETIVHMRTAIIEGVKRAEEIAPHTVVVPLYIEAPPTVTVHKEIEVCSYDLPRGVAEELEKHHLVPAVDHKKEDGQKKQQADHGEVVKAPLPPQDGLYHGGSRFIDPHANAEQVKSPCGSSSGCQAACVDKSSNNCCNPCVQNIMVTTVIQGNTYVVATAPSNEEMEAEPTAFAPQQPPTAKLPFLPDAFADEESPAPEDSQKQDTEDSLKKETEDETKEEANSENETPTAEPSVKKESQSEGENVEFADNLLTSEPIIEEPEDEDEQILNPEQEQVMLTLEDRHKAEDMHLAIQSRDSIDSRDAPLAIAYVPPWDDETIEDPKTRSKMDKSTSEAATQQVPPVWNDLETPTQDSLKDVDDQEILTDSDIRSQPASKVEDLQAQESLVYPSVDLDEDDSSFAPSNFESSMPQAQFSSESLQLLGAEPSEESSVIIEEITEEDPSFDTFDGNKHPELGLAHQQPLTILAY